MLTKGAIGNLVNQYKAVLKKCHLINVFGSLAVASMLVLGSAGMAAGAPLIVDYDSPMNEYAPVTDAADLKGYEVIITGGVHDRIYGVKPKIRTDYTADGNTLIVRGGSYENAGRPPIVAAANAFRIPSQGNDTVFYLSNNTTIIEKFTIPKDKYGALDAYGAVGQCLSAKNNTIELRMSEGMIDSAIGATINYSGNAEQNNAIYEGSGSVKFLLGARLNHTLEGYIAKNNTVTMNSGTVSHYIAGALSKGAAHTNKNSVKITGGNANIINGGLSFGGSADENSVSISGDASVKSYITGGMANTSAINNVITISGKPTLDNANIYGGAYCEGEYVPRISDLNNPSSDFRTGNTLRMETLGLTAKNIYNFEKYHFLLPCNVKNKDYVLRLTDPEKEGTYLGKDPKIAVAIETGHDFKPGSRVNLISNEAAGISVEGNLEREPLVVTARQGVSLEYELEIGLDEEKKNLYAELSAPPVEPNPEQPGGSGTSEPQPSVSVNPQTKSLSEGRTAMLAFVNQGAELIAERGMEAARQEALEGSLTPFLAGQGGKSRYDTGSHVDVTGFSLIAGLTSAKKTEIGTATMAAFFESGWADYDAHNSFASAASVNADGNTRYYGGGLLAHMAFRDFGPGHAYAETSLRTGWAETDYHSGDLRDSFGNTAAYDSGSAYYGAHFGLGYEWKLSDVSALDFYAKYFWTHQEGDHVRVMSDPIHFESADSHRSRFGVRYEHEFKTDGMVVKPFIGAAYEYEYDGDVAGTAYGFAMDKPSLRGGTGAGELGVTLKSSENSAFSLNLSVQGYTGTREGVSGSFLLNYRF